MKHTPTYAAAFRCVGSRCEDACCANWDIPIDKNTESLNVSNAAAVTLYELRRE